MATSMFDTSGGSASTTPTAGFTPTGGITPTGQSQPQALNTLTAQQQSWMKPQDWEAYNKANANGWSYMAPQSAPQSYMDTPLGQAVNPDGSVYGSWSGSGGGLDSSYYNADRTAYAPDARARIAASNQLDQVGVTNPLGAQATLSTPGLLGGASQMKNAPAAQTYSQKSYPMNAQVPAQQSGQGMLGGAPQQAGGASGMGQLQTGNGGSFAGFGWDSVAPVQQAMMGRLQPGMDQARQDEINRLKAQGIPENSPAWSRAMDTLNRSDTDARQQALLGGLGEQNTLWNQNLSQANFGNQSNQQAFNQNQSTQQMSLAQRQQAMAEQNNPLYQMSLLNGMVSNPAFSQFTNAGANKGVDYTKAGEDAYAAELAKSNSESAAQAAKQAAIAQIIGGVGSSAVNGGAASGAANAVGGLLSGAGNWFSGLFGG